MIVLDPCIHVYGNKDMVSRTTLRTLCEDCPHKASCKLHKRIKQQSLLITKSTIASFATLVRMIKSTERLSKGRLDIHSFVDHLVVL